MTTQNKLIKLKSIHDLSGFMRESGKTDMSLFSVKLRHPCWSAPRDCTMLECTTRLHHVGVHHATAPCWSAPRDCTLLKCTMRLHPVGVHHATAPCWSAPCDCTLLECTMRLYPCWSASYDCTSLVQSSKSNGPSAPPSKTTQHLGRSFRIVDK